MSKPAGVRLKSIDALRGAAAMVVMLGHLAASPTLTPSPGSLLDYLLAPLFYSYTGVGLFLVISGFCIHLGYSKKRVSFLEFWQRRFLRLYPPYFVVAILSILTGVLGALRFSPQIALVWPMPPYSTAQDFYFDVVTHLFMLHSLFGPTLEGLYNPPFWSLALEEQLYLLYWGWIKLLQRLSALQCLAVAMVVSLIWNSMGDSVVWHRLGPGRWYEWCLGAVAADAYRGQIRLPRFCADLRLSVLLIALAISPVLVRFSDMLFGTAYFILLHHCVKLDCESPSSFQRKLPRLLAWVGVWSYSLYLMHTPIFKVSYGVLAHLGLSGLWYAQLGLMLPAALLGSWLFFQLVERHFLYPDLFLRRGPRA